MASKSTISADFLNVLGRKHYFKLTLTTWLTTSEVRSHTAQFWSELLAITLSVFQNIIVASVT